MRTDNRVVALRKSPVLIRVIVFLGLLAGFSLALSPLPAEEHIVIPFTALTCSQAAWVINLFGLGVVSHNTVIAGSGFSVDVQAGCNAIYEIGLFVSALVASPSTFKHKLFGILWGIPVVYGFNLARVIALFVIGTYYRGFFEMLHDHVSQGLFILFVVVLWLLWASKAGRGSDRKHGAAVFR